MVRLLTCRCSSQGEAQVLADGVEVNRLFRADFFGEQALLRDEPRKATVVAAPGKRLVVLALDRTTFTNVLGPLQDLMAKEKSEEVCVQFARVLVSECVCVWCWGQCVGKEWVRACVWREREG
jgi:CRP-like cAMP-binding protein